MNTKTWWWLAIVLCLSFTVISNPEQYHLKLLAVQETDDGYQGSDADLYLELKPGSGRVFLETYPLTKMDTQISTRFAKEIACSHFKLNCNLYDFIYTIRAKSNIIGGPSAGAAIAALTTIAVLDLQYDEEIAITGTINSGAIIGPVGGIKEKIEAAAAVGIDKVLIAKGTGLQRETIDGKNETLDLVQYAPKKLELKVVEVTDLDEVIFELTGTQLNGKIEVLTEDPAYNQIMKELQELLCGRTQKIEEELQQRKMVLEGDVFSAIEQRKANSRTAIQQGNYYSAASYCFGTNILLKTNYYKQEGNKDSFAALFKALEQKTNDIKSKLFREKIETISDLQTSMIVRERLNEVQEQMEEFKENGKNYSVEEAASSLAYAEERLFSAQSWTKFFAMDGKKFILDEEQLQDSCIQKISEAEERHQYTSLFLGEVLVQRIEDKVVTAKKAQENQEYELCLITASQAKADANAILSSLGLDEHNFKQFLDGKKMAAARVIAENSAEDVFPILGYSYYQYAASLQEDEPFTALVYYEDALEMSDLQIYFPEEKSYLENVKQPAQLPEKWKYAFGGIAIGIFIGAGIFWLTGLTKKRRR